MLWKTHLSLALIIAYIASVEVGFSLIILILAVIGGLLPDIDEKHSKIGKHFKTISFIFDHRGFFHTVWMGGILSVIILETLGKISAIVFFAAYLSHLLLDAITISGIRPFLPIQLKISGGVKTGGFFEKVIFYSLIMVFILIANI